MAETEREEIVAGLDLGTHEIKCVIAVLHDNGQVDVLGTGVHPAEGIECGAVCNHERAVASIKKAVADAEMMAGCDLKEVFIAVSGRHLESFDSLGLARIEAGQVSQADIARAADLVRAVKLPKTHGVLHVVPQAFIVDGQGVANDPRTVPGVRLEMHGHVVTGHLESIAALEACCVELGLKVRDVFHAGLAQAEVILPQESQEMGVALLDIGADTTELTVFQGGAVIHTNVLEFGGKGLSGGIKKRLDLPMAEAERLKCLVGCALPARVPPELTAEVPGLGGLPPRQIECAALADVIEAHLVPIFESVRIELNQLTRGQGLPCGLVLTGGTANIQSLADLARQVLDMPVVVGTPLQLYGLVDVVKNPRYSTATGVVMCALRKKQDQWFSTKKHTSRKSGLSRVFSFLPGVK